MLILVRRALTFALACGLLAIAFTTPAHAQCELNSPSGKIKHVVYIEFDNVHFTRDNPNVPSDLEQMPALKNFIEQHGTLDAGDHAILISHTANDILTTQIGLYSDNTGIFISNSYGVFANGAGLFPSAFFYWTDLTSDINAKTNDSTFALTTPSGQNVPAPWVPFTRAGCTVGAFSTANIVLERAPFDIYKVFGGPTSPQGMESSTNQNNDFIGAAIHCALNDPLCQSNPALGVVAVPDTLPEEPGGYTGYKALFGLKYMNPALTGSATGSVVDYHGVPLTGFNQLSFDPTPAQTLAVVETMLKKGIPVVYAYIADAHDNQEEKSVSSANTFGPGEAPYVAQLADYNSAFETFFLHLKEAGIDESNTLFVFTPDEGDHFVGGAATPADCDGAKIEKDGSVVPDVPCTYGPNGVGELQINLAGLTAAAGDPTPYTIHFDDAATTYVTGQPIASDPSVRTLEKTMAGLSAVNPHTGLSESLLGTGLGPQLQGAIVDPVAMKLLHMNTVADPNREPTFTFFGDPNYFFQTNGSTTPVVGSGFAWNHGDIQPEIARTFIGMVGPGVKNLGVTHTEDFFTDHVDLRPTIMQLVGLTDDYQHDGRTITELLDEKAKPSSLRAHSDTLEDLGQLYKQIDAPFGELAKNTLKVSTFAITSTSNGDAVYSNLENQIASWTEERDGLAAQIKSMLDDAEFGGEAIDNKQAKDIIAEGEALLDQSEQCVANLNKCGE